METYIPYALDFSYSISWIESSMADLGLDHARISLSIDSLCSDRMLCSELPEILFISIVQLNRLSKWSTLCLKGHRLESLNVPRTCLWNILSRSSPYGWAFKGRVSVADIHLSTDIHTHAYHSIVTEVVLDVRKLRLVKQS